MTHRAGRGCWLVGWEFSQHARWNTLLLFRVVPAPAAWGLAFKRKHDKCAEVEVASALKARPPKSPMTAPLHSVGQSSHRASFPERERRLTYKWEG